MECCDSVSADVSYINQPSGICSSTSSRVLLLPRERTSYLSSASPSNQGNPERSKRVEREGVEKRTFDDGYGKEKQINDCDGDDFVKPQKGCDKDGNKADEVECQIVYQADGSAYILESQSQLPCSVVLSSSRPSVISLCHFSSPQNSNLKSFHVFHPKNWCHLTRDIIALLTCQSKDSASARSGLNELPLPGKEQPILVCFPCCLSFKHINAFRLHISQHHTIPVTTEEQQLLTLPHTCAIVHPVGLSNHLVLSFLEPKTSIVQTAPSQLPTTKPGCNMASMLSQEGRENFQMSEPGFSLQPSLPRAPLPTSMLSPAKDHSTLGREGPQLSIDGDLGKEGESSEEGEESLSSLVVSTAKDGASSSSSSGRQGHMNEPPLSNQSDPKSPDSVTVATSFMNNTKSPTDSELECGRSFNCHGPAPVSSTVQIPSTATVPKELANQESVMETEPNNMSEKGSVMAKQPNAKLCDNTPATSYSDLPSNHSSSKSPGIPQQINKSMPEDGQVDVGRGSLLAGSDHDFVAGRDSNQGSSYSYGAQLPMTHSRNSCKTLKCPKCNWHYKYQQTLEAHMKEKHPDADDGQCPYCASGQDHPRLARGETYTCGYKPFRCHVCQYSTTTKGNLSIHMQSDKHLNNMQNLQAQTRPDAPPVQPNHLPHPHSTQTASPSPSKPPGRASWRCEVCDYETNVARNLRIHMTSEKHTHNMLLLQQNLAHMQRQHRQNAHDIYQYSQSQNRLPNPGTVQSAGEALQDKSVEEDPPDALFECALCGHFSSDSLGSLSQHLAAQRSLPDADWRSTTGDAHLCRLCHYVTPLRANFQLHCQTDKHLQRYQLAAHLQEASKHHRNPEEEEEWLLRCVAAGVQVQLRCNACSYEANSLEKLKLHTLNIRHKASVKLYKYLQQFEGAVSDGAELHCVLCDYSTQNSLSLVQHSNLLSHQRVEGLIRLQRIQSGLQDEEEELSAIFKIRKSHAQDSGDVTEMESSTEMTSDQEDQTKHTGKEEEKTAIHTEKRSNESSIVPKRPHSASEDLEDAIPSKLPRAQEEISSEQVRTEQVRQCPFCRFSHTDLGRLRNHVMIQHAVQPTLRCPLCQETLRSVALMRTHLTQLHSVTTDCTQKLINAVIASDVLPEKMFLPVQDSNTQQTKADSSCNGTKRPDEQSDDEQEKVTTCQPEIAKTQKQPLEDAESTKENTAAFPCWQKGCNKVLTSSAALQQHVNHFHSQKQQMPISDRHVYKYRCNQCSLAFKTAEKLQLHSQYHAIRAATMCCLCQRSFRTVQALQKHLETSHLELSEIQLQQLCGSLLLTEDLLGSVDQGLDDEQGSPEEEKEKEIQESDQEEKVSPPDSGLSLAQEDSDLNPKPPVPPLRKCSNPSTEKFLDPSRPFKCTVCKESFTQKNILLVHYNSVSHLHKVKRSVQDSSIALPESVSSSTDHKPFKCSICNVAYSQSSTLEIHMRSVLHQTKARAAKHDLSGMSSTNVNSLVRKAASDNTLASYTTALKPSNDTNNVSCISSSIDQPYLKNQQSTELSVVSSSQISHSSHTEESKKKQMLDAMALTTTAHKHKLFQQQQLQQQQLAQAQAQIQQELQKKAAILQSHLFNPALLHHFPITADALLPLQQQQQMLLPFLLPGGEFQISPELNLKGSGINLNPTMLIAPENCSEPSLQISPSSSCKQPSKGDGAHISHQSVSPSSKENSSVLQKADEKMLTFDPKRAKGKDGKNYCKETGQVPKTTSKDSLETFKLLDGVEEEVSDGGKMFTELIPPRVAHDAPGNVSKALLENIGFELVVHFNENKQQYEKDQADAVPNEESKTSTEEIQKSETSSKLECESCGKLFSNALILKSHKEHIHQSIFPIQSLEKFAKDYREQYDKLFPFKHETPTASPLLAIPASPPPPLDEQTQQKPVPCISTSTTTVTSPSVSTSQVPLPPLPLTLDLPLFPPLMMHSMPLQTLPPQLSVHLPPVDAGLTTDLAQLYHQQLTPSLMQQQGKRPRTRITDDQLRILRQYFDINNSPNDDQIQEMGNKSGLPNKVIKHWFRNTLFKERQRNKDSPYNFNNPPITTLEDFKMDSRPSSPEPPKQEFSGGRRSSRTRFTDYQLRVLQDFFDANAYPKDDEFEELSNLLNLPTRVIVVWFQNARQKAKKNYENQADGGKDTEHRELSNDHYICTPNGTYECKKCSMIFQRIFDLLRHQKKVCYKDEDEEDCSSQNELLMDAKSSSSPNLTLTNFSFSNDTDIDVNTEETSNIKEEFDHDTDSPTEDRRQITEKSHDPQDDESNQVKESKDPNEIKQQTSTKTSSPSPLHQFHQANPPIPQTSQAELNSPQMTIISPSSQQQHPSPSQQMTPYHCIQCKLSFPSFEHWQEHQQMHFLVAQNHFVHSQFLDRPMDIPLMLFDSANPLVARQVLSGAFPQIPLTSSTIAVPDSTINSLKRKLEQKSDTNSVENDWENNNDDSQRDKRMRTTITPEQLEILYQKYLLDSNPTRQMLDNISQEVGLKKRVVQVWFQNTRARERKGQFRAMGPVQAHRRCPFCRALFKAQTALDAHIRSRHWHEAKNAGYSMEVAGMTHELEGSQMKMDLLNISNCSQLANLEDSLNGADSPSCKNIDFLSNQQHSSPRTLKSDGLDNVEGSGSFDCSRQDNLKDILLGTVPIGATANDENDFDEKHNSTDHLASSSDKEASLENEDKMSPELVSPAMSFNAKEYDNDLILDYSEDSSLADPSSPCPGGSSQNIDVDRLGQKRYRTQLSNLQVKVLKACFSDYKTPTMLECEALGNDIGLPKRVVQVWFQNARAKEKKAKLSLAKQFGTESTCTDRPKTECTLCCVKYSTCLSVRDHIFSQQHLEKVKEALGGQLDREREYVDVHPLMCQEGMDHLNKSSDALAVAKTRPAESSGSFSNLASKCLNIQGAGSKPMTNISSAKSDPSDVTSNGLISRSSTSSSLSTSTDKPSASTTNTVLTPKHTLSDPKLQFSKESICEKNTNTSKKIDSGSAKSATDSNTCTTKEKKDSLGPATSTLKTGKAYSMEAAQLQALQAAGLTDPTSLLSNPLLPCLMPGFPQIFPPQMPTALTGSFLQPMFGMEGMFQYGSVLPQTLMGLSPSSVLQQYQHNLQGALMHHRLQLQQKQLLQQQPQKSKVSQISASPYSQDMAHNKGLVLNLSKSEEKQGTSDGSSSSFLSSTKPMNNSFLVGQCIVSKGMCKEKGKEICLYDCLVCEISLMGNEELIQHLENPQHKQRAAEHLNAKEHASCLLPHISSSSTSQPNPPSKQMSPSIFQPRQSAPESPSDNPCISKTTDCS